MRSQCLVEVTERRRIRVDPRDHAVITIPKKTPLDHRFGALGNRPWIKYKRTGDWHAVASLGAYFAANNTELQRMHALDPHRSGEHGEDIADFAATQSGSDCASHDGLDMLVGVIARPRIGVDLQPSLL